MQQYAAVVPVKPPAHGKSRLGGLAGVPDEQRHALAEAFALDTVAACTAAARVARVLVATDDASVAGHAAALGAEVLPDGDARGLNPVLRQAVVEVARRWPHLRPVAVCADLPALRPGDLDLALDEATRLGGAPAYVADHTGAGTTLYTAAAGEFEPCFGSGSAAAHRSGGAVPLTGTWESLRLDVDEVGDLDAAAAWGLGPATAARWPPRP